MSKLPLDIFSAAVERFTNAEKLALSEWQRACDCVEPGTQLECRYCPYYKKLGLLIQSHVICEAEAEHELATITSLENEEPYSETTKQQALQLFDLGYSLQDIQYLLNIPARRELRKWLRQREKLPGFSSLYSEVLKQQCVSKYIDGQAPKQIEDETGVPADVITFWALQAGVRRASKYTEQEKQNCLELYQSGKSSNEVSRLTGIPAKTVRMWAWRAGITREQKQYSEGEKQNCIDLYLAGKSSSEVSEITGIKAGTIRSWLKKLNLSRGSQGSPGHPSV
jgi:transposase-like protein